MTATLNGLEDTTLILGTNDANNPTAHPASSTTATVQFWSGWNMHAHGLDSNRKVRRRVPEWV